MTGEINVKDKGNSEGQEETSKGTEKSGNR